jgi:hypothetical protein
MEQSLNFLVQPLVDIELIAKQETMEHYQATILHVERTAEFVSSATLVDIVTRAQRHEVDLKDGLTQRMMMIII